MSGFDILDLDSSKFCKINLPNDLHFCYALLTGAIIFRQICPHW